MAEDYDYDSIIEDSQYNEDNPDYMDEDTQHPEEQADAITVSNREINKLATMNNIAEILSDEELSSLSMKCLRDLEEDTKSMADKLRVAERAYKLVLPEGNLHPKNTPFPNAANIKHPLLETASFQYQSRSLSDSIKNGKLASFKLYGQDNGVVGAQGEIIVRPGSRFRKAKRLMTYMNYYLMEKDECYMDMIESLNAQLSICGWSYTKTWYDPINEMPRVSLCSYDRLIVNDNSPSFKDIPRFSEYIDSMTTATLISYIRAGLFCDINVYNLPKDESDIDSVFHEIVEQHTTIDLDSDGYPEPYIVTIHKATAKILRIKANYTLDRVIKNNKGKIKHIVPYTYYTLYTFQPSFDNTLHGYGFGSILYSSNETINTLLNQLTNAGTLATMSGGFLGKGIRLKAGQEKFKPGEWKTLPSTDGSDLKNNIYEFNFKEPSQVLFALVQYLIESFKDLTSTTDAMTGSQDATNVSPNTILQIIEQGQKVYTSIFRRTTRARKNELKLLLNLIKENLDIREYLAVTAPSMQDFPEMFDQDGNLLDFNDDLINIVPVVDLNDATPQLRQIQAQGIMQFGIQAAQFNGANVKECFKNLVQSFEVDDPDRFVPPDPPPGTPSPEAIQVQLQQANFDSQMKLKVAQHELKEREVAAKTELQKAQAVKTLADAETTQDSAQLDVYKTAIDKNIRQEQNAINLHKVNLDAQAKVDKTMSDHVSKENDQQVKKDIAKMQTQMKIEKEKMPSREEVEAEARNRGFK